MSRKRSARTAFRTTIAFHNYLLRNALRTKQNRGLVLSSRKAELHSEQRLRRSRNERIL